MLFYTGHRITTLRGFASQLVKGILRNIKHFTERPEVQLRDIANSRSNLSFDPSTKHLSISNSLTWDQRRDLRYFLRHSLRKIKPINSIPLGTIVTGYFDQCLERYLFERIDRLVENKNTCWFRLASNNMTVGHLDSTTDQKNELKALISKNPKLLNHPVSKFEITSDNFVVLKSNTIYDTDDKVLKLAQLFFTYGFWNSISSESPIILTYSKSTKKYQAVSGRHRIAALRYLHGIGRFSAKKPIACHIVEMQFDSLVVTRPYTKECKSCDWGGIYDPGRGTHQDFYLREGIPFLRASNHRKGGLQKLKLLTPYFNNEVKNSHYLDIGAHRGLFAFKAIQLGASLSVALELNDRMVDFMQVAKVKYQLDDFQIINGDFYDPNVFENLVAHKFDCVSCLGIIHHLLCLGISNNILNSFDELIYRIATLAKRSVFVEFAQPRSETIQQHPYSEHASQFGKLAFEYALTKHFPRWQNLGRVRYTTFQSLRRSNSSRYLYYGRKA